MALLSQIDPFKLAMLLVFVVIALIAGKINRRQKLLAEQLRRGQVGDTSISKSELAASLRVASLHILTSDRLRASAYIAIAIQLPFALIPEHDALTMQLLAFSASVLMLIREALYHYSELIKLGRAQYSESEDWFY